jgi:uncharacterized protein YkuJ
MVDIRTGWRREEFEVNGELVDMEMRPLKKGAVFELMAVRQGAAESDVDAVYIKIFDEHVRDIRNLTIDGEAVTNEDIVNEALLMPLCTAMMTRLDSMSVLSKADEKNSNRQLTSPQPGEEAKS